MTWSHRLTDVDLENKTAVCAVCGPTGIKVRLRGGKVDRACGTHHKKLAKISRRRTGRPNRKRADPTYDALLQEQGGVCAICKEPPGTMKLSVDHDHRCCPLGSSCEVCVRGLLCHRCNLALGGFNDDIVTLQHAMDYLLSYRF
jgi:hypothetical protein